jgi:hypothetical protein
MENGFTRGESVVYTQNGTHYNAIILELYADGTAQVSFPGGEFAVSQISLSTLSVALNVENGFYLNEAVVYTQDGMHYDAKIDALYADGTALVEFPNGEFAVSQISLSTLSVALMCTGTCAR